MSHGRVFAFGDSVVLMGVCGLVWYGTDRVVGGDAVVNEALHLVQ